MAALISAAASTCGIHTRGHARASMTARGVREWRGSGATAADPQENCGGGCPALLIARLQVLAPIRPERTGTRSSAG